MWFMRVGDVGGETSLPNLGVQSVNMPSANELQLMFGNTSTPYSVYATYLLTGGALGTSNANLIQTFQLSNISPEALSLHVFSYSLFTLKAQPMMRAFL